MADKLDLTKPVQTRDGRPVRILCADARFGAGYTIVGLIDNGGADAWCSWKPSGFAFQDGMERNYDLINVPPKPVKYYVDVFSNQCGGISLSRAYTDKRPDGWLNVGSFIKTIEFEV